MSDSLWPQELYPARLLCPWNSPGKNTGVGSRSLLQGIFPIQGSNPGLLHCRWIINHLNPQGSPRLLEWVAFPTLGELPDLEIEPWSPALQADSLPAELPFLSTWASIRQEKKELNMLMLPPLLGDIWVCIQRVALLKAWCQRGFLWIIFFLRKDLGHLRHPTAVCFLKKC